MPRMTRDRIHDVNSRVGRLTQSIRTTGCKPTGWDSVLYLCEAVRRTEKEIAGAVTILATANGPRADVARAAVKARRAHLRTRLHQQYRALGTILDEIDHRQEWCS